MSPTCFSELRQKTPPMHQKTTANNSWRLLSAQGTNESQRRQEKKKKSNVRAILICIEQFIKINIYVFKIHGRSISCVPSRAIQVLLEVERITSHKKNQTLSWWLKQRGANCVAPSMPSPYFSIVSQHLACVAARLMQETWLNNKKCCNTDCLSTTLGRSRLQNAFQWHFQGWGGPRMYHGTIFSEGRSRAKWRERPEQ